MREDKEKIRLLMEQVLDYANTRGIQQTDLLFERGDAFSLQAQFKKIDKSKVSSFAIMGIRSIQDNKTGISYSESLEMTDLKQMVDESLMNAQFSSPDPWQNISLKNGQDIIGVLPKSKSKSKSTAVSIEEKINLALKLENDILRADERITSVPYSGYSEGESEKFYLNHLGSFCYQSQPSYSCYTSALAKEGLKKSMYFKGTRALSFHELDEQFCVQETLRHTLPLLDGKSVPSGSYDVIFDTDTLHELLGCYQNLFSAKSAMEAKNPFKDRLGDIVSSPLFNLMDCPKYADALYPSYFDDEGAIPQDVTLIEDGVLKNFYHNTATSKFFKGSTTGHATRSPKSAMGVSGTYWVIAAGNSLEKELRSGKYLEIIDLQGLHSGTNPFSGHFSLAAKGYLYLNDKIVQPVNNITISGNIFDLLKSIVGLGNKIHLSAHRSFFSPTIRFASLSVAG